MGNVSIMLITLLWMVVHHEAIAVKVCFTPPGLAGETPNILKYGQDVSNPISCGLVSSALCMLSCWLYTMSDTDGI